MARKILFFILSFVCVFMLFPMARAQTEVNQHITRDTIWTIHGSPYVVNPLERDLYVEEHATLRIEPGVVVKFANGRALDVHGKLIAEGNPENHIVFTSIYDMSTTSYDQPAKGDWYGININGNESSVKYTQIKYAGKEGYRDYKDAALVIVGEGHVVHNNFIQGSDSDCLHMYFAFASIQKNLFQKCDGSGISTNQGKSEISYNILQMNEVHGITLSSYANIRGNMIQLNKEHGILVGTEANDPDIRGNHIDMNGEAGISLQHAISSVKQNAITNNQIGIELDSAVGRISVEGNDFVANGVGMEIRDVIANNDLYRLIKAEDNWWGDEGGPHDPSDDRRKNRDGLYNPNDIGDPISDYIDYDGWSMEPNTKFLVPQQINTEAPTIPRGVVSTFLEDRILISWEAGGERDVVGFNVFKSKQELEGYEKITSVTVNYFTDREFSRGETYYYKISAVDFSGNESFLSHPLVVETSELQPGTVFKDVNNAAWYGYYINALKNRNIVQGYSDGTFRPNNPVTRAELVKMVLEATSVSPGGGGDSIFWDVPPNQWFSGYVNTAYYRGIVSGVDENHFAPERNVTRAEAIKIILKAYGFTEYWPQSEHFQDVPRGTWYFHYIEYALSRGMINSAQFFRPNDIITRAEVAKMITMIERQ